MIERSGANWRLPGRKKFSWACSAMGAAVLAGMLVAAMPLRGSAEEATATNLIFSEPYLKNLGYPASISYRYSHDTPTPEDYGSPFEESVMLTVSPPNLDGGFNSVAIAFAGEGRNYSLGPFENTSGNPVVMMFLERDLNQMRSRIGGTPVYFRNTIRRAFRDSAVVEDTSVDVKGVQVPAKRITIRPFVDDQNAGRFGKFQGKIFETIVTDAVPGGIYAMRSFIRDGGSDHGTLVLNELQYQTDEQQ